MTQILLDTAALNVQKLSPSLYFFEWHSPKSKDEALYVFAIAIGCLKLDLFHTQITNFNVIVDGTKVSFDSVRRIMSYSFWNESERIISLSSLFPDKIVTILPKNDLLTKVGLSVLYEKLKMEKDFVLSLSEAFEVLGIEKPESEIDILSKIKKFVSDSIANGLPNYDILASWASFQDLENTYQKGLTSFEDYQRERTKLISFFTKKMLKQ